MPKHEMDTKRVVKRQRYRKNSHGPSKFTEQNNNEVLITTKRLTVGIRGIFGSSRQSNSVCRNIQEQLNKTALSSKMSADMKSSLNRILQRDEEKKDDISAHSKYAVVGLPEKTPENSSISIERTPHSSKKTTSTNDSFSESLTLEKYIDISNRVKTRIPDNSYLKRGRSIFKKLREDLRQVYESKCSLDINPIFQFDKEAEMSSQDEEIKTPNVIPDICQDTHMASPLLKKVKNNTDDSTKSRTNIDLSENSSNHEAITGAFGYKNEKIEGKINSKSITNQESHILMHQFYGKENDEPASFNAGAFEQKNRDKIFDQPLYLLRSSRRLNKSSGEEQMLDKRVNESSSNDRFYDSSQVLSNSSDILDLIDSIPIPTLEKNFFSSEEKDNNFNRFLEMKKPVVKSPSPPKLYRMSMF